MNSEVKIYIQKVSSAQSMKMNATKTILICIALVVSTSLFSQHQFTKRKYMKGFFIEKKSKHKKVEEVHTQNKMITVQLTEAEIKESEVCEKEEVRVVKKEDGLENLYLPKMANEPIKEVTTIRKESKSYSRHNTINADTVLYCYDSKKIPSLSPVSYIIKNEKTSLSEVKNHSLKGIRGLVRKILEALAEIALYTALALIAIVLLFFADMLTALTAILVVLLLMCLIIHVVEQFIEHLFIKKDAEPINKLFK